MGGDLRTCHAGVRRQKAEVSAAVEEGILRQDNYLDRQLERKIRLLDMLQEKRRKREAASQAPEIPAVPPPYMKMQTLTHQVVENTPAASSSLAREKPGARTGAPVSGPKTRLFAPSG